MNASATNRRQFFRTTGLAAGTLSGLGLGGKGAAGAAPARVKLQGAREVPSVCPYCAVGCVQIISVRGGHNVKSESYPDFRINRDRLFSYDASAFQLSVHPNRLMKAQY